MTRTRALLVIIILQLAAFGWLSYRVLDVTSGVHAAAHEALTLATTIQHERKESILAGCRDQNARHRHTIHQLDQLLKIAELQHPARSAQIRASMASTVLLIDALAPHRNCRLVVRHIVHS